MAKYKTQDQCKREFVDKLSRFEEELQAIDDDMPASPIEEPDWWIEMMNLQNSMNALIKKFK